VALLDTLGNHLASVIKAKPKQWISLANINTQLLFLVVSVSTLYTSFGCVTSSMTTAMTCNEPPSPDEDVEAPRLAQSSLDGSSVDRVDDSERKTRSHIMR
jgi:hypothetical protein